MADETLQKNAAAYRLAALDADFIRGDSMRGVHLLLEYSKAEERLRSWGIHSTVVVFGSAQNGGHGRREVPGNLQRRGSRPGTTRRGVSRGSCPNGAAR